jgi:ABC-type nitrate/sulfonate/bicarbonate transport system substrate-binding protein
MRRLVSSEVSPLWPFLFPVALALSLLFSSCQQKVKPPVEKITIAFPLIPSAALLIVANEKGYYLEEGLEVAQHVTHYGKDAVDAMMAGTADFAYSAETPFVFTVLKDDGILVVTKTMQSTKNIAIIALRDRGVDSPADLKGKRVGFLSGTVAQYFLDTFLTVRGIPRGSIRTVHLAPDAMENALRAGKVDAVAVWQPFILALGKTFGTGAVTFFDESIYTWTSVVTARKKFVAERPDAVRKLLRALLKAEAFIGANPAETLDIVARATGMNRKNVEISMEFLDFRIGLDQSFLNNLESQARWAIRNRLSDRTEVPNFLDFFYLDGLKAVKPDAVTVNH